MRKVSLFQIIGGFIMIGLFALMLYQDFAWQEEHLERYFMHGVGLIAILMLTISCCWQYKKQKNEEKRK